MNDYLSVGVVTTAHGVHGELKVFPTTDDAKRFKKLKHVLVENKGETSKRKVVSVKFFKQFVILKLEGIDTMDDALTYKNATLLVDRKDAVKCEEDEYFIADLIGLSVFDDNHDLLGVISEVYQTGANDVYEIKRSDESTFLIPAIKDCILNVNIKENEMVIHLLPGLLD